jgi:hypothetical protein
VLRRNVAGTLDRSPPGSEPPDRAGSYRRAGRMALRYKTLDFLNICSPQVREMYEHWAALRGERILPHRDDLETAEIIALLHRAGHG